MSLRTNWTLIPDGSQHQPPVRVRSHRITADAAKLIRPMVRRGFGGIG